uniref:Uncharacterized protein n=1 Tax=Haemonchus contortus TaxID=6289 RepID=W6NQ32_HAECO
MTISGKGSKEGDLIGERLTVSLNVLSEQCQALEDTGTMTTIVPAELLAKEQDKCVDVDTLRMIPKAKLMPVNDASHRAMKFIIVVEEFHPPLRCVIGWHIELEDGCTRELAFHISPTKEFEGDCGNEFFE